MDKPTPGDAATTIRQVVKQEARQEIKEQNTSPFNQTKASDGVKPGDCIRGRFILEEEIGRGGMGIVFRALDLRKQETGDKDTWVALKVMSNAVKQLPESLIALQREAKKAQKLAHPNVATVYDFDRDGNEAFVTMELLQGHSLADLFKSDFADGLSFEQALPIMQGMARGLAYAHQQGIVHSDFKPGNVFVSDKGQVKILDFGIARAISHTSENEKTSNEQTLFDPGNWDAITPAYASLEMFYRAPPDPRDDIYALACVCYQLLSGRHPFEKKPANKAKAENLKVKPLKHIGNHINKLLQQGLALERKDRLPSANDFLDGLEPQKNKLLTWLSVILITVVAVGAGLYGFYLLQERELIEANDPWLAVPQAVDADTSERISRLLVIAEAHLSVGRYIKPTTSNAAEAYMEVLRLQPGNKRALEGIETIVQHITNEVRSLQGENKFEEANTLIARAVSVIPGEKRLSKLQSELNNK